MATKQLHRALQSRAIGIHMDQMPIENEGRNKTLLN